MKSMNNYTLVLLLLLSCTVFTTSQSYAQADTATVEVVKDARVDQLVRKQAIINKVSVYKNSRGEYRGYRIMVMNTNNRTLAYKTRSDILRNYPEYNVYMAYQTPYFKIKMGDFLKRADADKLRKELSSMFPQGMFVVQDIIKLTPEEETKLFEEVEEEE